MQLNTLRASMICGALGLAFVAGSMFGARALNTAQAKAEGNRLFQLMIYHTYPGKAPELESIFRKSHTLQAKYLNVIGYWVPTEDPAWKDTFVYLVAHPSREAADKNWHAFHSDPAFPPYQQAAIPLIQHTGDDDFKVEEIYMRASDFSALK